MTPEMVGLMEDELASVEGQLAAANKRIRELEGFVTEVAWRPVQRDIHQEARRLLRDVPLLADERGQLRPLTYLLGQRRRDMRIPRHVMAAHIGVAASTILRWECGQRSPHFRHAVAYAGRVGCLVVLADGRRVLAEGMDIPGALPRLRKAAGLTHREFAPLLHVGKTGVVMQEVHGFRTLVSVERYAAGLGLALGLAEVLADDPGVGKTTGGEAP